MELDFVMQPLSRVKPDAVTQWGNPETMTLRPGLAAKVARCISQWSEIEVHCGAFLGLLLHANQEAAVAMYSGLENRAAQLRLISLAAEASLPPAHFDTISVFLTSILRPAMRERDKFAHWAWGHSDDLPEALLISEPQRSLKSLMEALRTHPGVDGAGVPVDFDKIYVVRDTDLDGVITRSMNGKFLLRVAMATVWDYNPLQERASRLQQLSSVPEIRGGLDRLAEARKKTQAVQQPSPQPNQNG